MRLSDFKVLTFDVYGTLIDWETGMVDALAPASDLLTLIPARDCGAGSATRRKE